MISISPTPVQHAVLVAWHAAEHPTVEGIAKATGRRATAVSAALTLLVRDGHMTRKARVAKHSGRTFYAYTVTPKGIAAAAAPCPVAPSSLLRPDRRRAKALPLPVAAVPAPAKAKPLRMPMTPAKAEPLPSMPLPTALQTFRGITHPPMPHGFKKPKGAGDWNFCTVTPSMGTIHT
jgi:hypothetical protein